MIKIWVNSIFKRKKYLYWRIKLKEIAKNILIILGKPIVIYRHKKMNSKVQIFSFFHAEFIYNICLWDLFSLFFDFVNKSLFLFSSLVITFHKLLQLLKMSGYGENLDRKLYIIFNHKPLLQDLLYVQFVVFSVYYYIEPFSLGT